ETGIYNITITLAGTSTSGVRLYKKLSDSDNLVPISEPFYVGTTTLTELSLEENAYIGLQTDYDYGDLGYFDLTGCSLVINSLTSTEPFVMLLEDEEVPAIYEEYKENTSIFCDDFRIRGNNDFVNTPHFQLGIQ